MNLTGKQKRYLRGLGNQLKPAVFIGRDGIYPSTLTAIERAIGANELIKVKLGEGFIGERHAAADELAHKAGAALVQVLGRTILLYRRHATEPKIELPG